MNAELKTSWLEALRSGNYKQCTGKLCNVISTNKSYCCLGVLLDVAKSKGFDMDITDAPHDYPGDNYCMRFTYKQNSSDGELPNSFREEVGISNVHEQQLIDMNDDDRSSFTEIADYIEKEL